MGGTSDGTQNILERGVKKRGRPGFSPTPAMKKNVANLVAAEVEKKEIAAALGISMPTLQKHFGALIAIEQAKAAERRANPGRPVFKPTPKQRRQCEGYAAFGMSRENIARVFGITPPTLDDYFAEELATGWAKKQAEAIDHLLEHSKKNASAAARVLDKLAIVAADVGAKGQADTPPDVPLAAVGKKEMAQIAAQSAGQNSDWGEDLIPGTRPN